MRKRYRTVAVGGTFDEFHKGHGALLVKAFEVGEEVLIGLCSDEFVKRMKKPHPTASYKLRFQGLKTFLINHNFLRRTRIISLNDAYGVTLSEGCAEALIVSKETEQNAIMINKKREKLGLPPLTLFVIEMVPSDNHVYISTTRIRRGEIDHDGHLLRT